MQTTHLTDQRHVVIPKTICDAYHLNIGQELDRINTTRHFIKT